MSPNPAPRDRFETDSRKIVNRHLEDEEHEISEEEMRSIRIGLSPDVVQQKSEEKLEEFVDDAARKEATDGEPETQPVTPWDAVKP